MRLVLAAALALALAAPAFAQAPVPEMKDALSDPTLKGKEVVAFIGLKPGDKIADVIAGRFIRIFSQTVGPKGHVYAIEPDEIVKFEPQVIAPVKTLIGSGGFSNVELVGGPVNAMPLPKGGLDAVFIRQNYHDLYDKFMGPADVPGFNKQVYAALKPGGVYVIIDHADAAGTGLKSVETTHRIDPARVKADVLAAGFKLEAESPMLANPADPHDKLVFDPSIRGKTDQFTYRFRKPK